MEFTTYTQNKIVGLLLVVLVAGAAFFPHIGSGSLWDRDETSYALVAKEMLARGNWSVPYRNGKLFIDKPAFTFWFIASAYKLFGISEFSARFFSAVFGVGAAVLVYWLGVVMFGPSSGLYGTLIFISSLMVTVICRSAVTDSYLLFFCTASLLAFRYAQQTGRWNFIYLFYLMMGLAVLVKGPIGVFLSAAPIFLYLLISKKLGLLKKMKIMKGGLIVMGVIAPWLVSVYMAIGGEFVSVFIMKHNIGRFLHPMESHGGGFWYYLPALVIGFFPWFFFLPRSFSSLYKQKRDAFYFLVCWAAVVFLFFSFGATKLPHYILPLFPPVSLIIGEYLSSWLAGDSESLPERRLFLVNMVIAGSCLLATLAIYAVDYKLASYKFVVTLTLLNAIVWGGYYFLSRNRRKTAFAALLTGMVFFYGVLSWYAIPQTEPSRVLVKMAKKVGKLAPKEVKLYSYAFFEPGLAFYSRRKINKLRSLEELKSIIEQPGAFFMFIRRKDFDTIKGSLRLHKIMEERGINEVKGRMHLLLLSNYSLPEYSGWKPKGEENEVL